MAELILYTRRGCGLCDRLRVLLNVYLDEDPALLLREVDVAQDPGLLEQFGLRIPVLMFGDEIILEGRPSECDVRRAIEPIISD